MSCVLYQTQCLCFKISRILKNRMDFKIPYVFYSLYLQSLHLNLYIYHSDVRKYTPYCIATLNITIPCLRQCCVHDIWMYFTRLNSQCLGFGVSEQLTNLICIASKKYHWVWDHTSICYMFPASTKRNIFLTVGFSPLQESVLQGKMGKLINQFF